MRARRREGCEGEERMEQTLRRRVGEDADAVQLIERVDKARDIFDQPGSRPLESDPCLEHLALPTRFQPSRKYRGYSGIIRQSTHFAGPQLSEARP